MWPASLNLTWNVSCTTVYLIKKKKWRLTINNTLHGRLHVAMVSFLKMYRAFTKPRTVILNACVFRDARRVHCLKAVRTSGVWPHSWTFKTLCIHPECSCPFLHTLTLCDISVSTIQSGILKSPVAIRSLTVEQSMKLCLISVNVHLNGHSRLVVSMPAEPEWGEKPAVSKSAGANNLLSGLRWSRIWVSLGNWAKQRWKCFPGLHSSVSQCLTSSPRGSGRPRSIQTALLV